MHRVVRNPQIVRHEPGIVIADRHEPVHVPHLFPNQSHRLAPIGLFKPFQEKILTLQRTEDRPLDGALQWTGQSDQEGVGEVDDVRNRLAFEPLE